MALTQDELQLMQAYKKAGKTKEQFSQDLVEYRQFRDKGTQKQDTWFINAGLKPAVKQLVGTFTKSIPEIAGKTLQTAKEWVQRIGEAGVWLAEGKYTAPEAFARGAAWALQTATSPLAGATSQTIWGAIEAVPQGIKDTVVAKVAPKVKTAKEWFEAQSPESKRQLGNIWVWAEVLSYLVGANPAKKVAGAGLKTVEKTGEGLVKWVDTIGTTAKQWIQAGKNVVKVAGDKIPNKVSIQKWAENLADTLSTNFNRMTAGQIKKFNQEIWVSPGKFLNDRGIVESGDKLVDRLTENMKASRKAADDAVEAVKWKFKAEKQSIATSQVDELWNYKSVSRDPIETMLVDNLDNASGKWDVKNSIRQQELLKKYRDWGLELKEVNEAKRYMADNNKFWYFTDDTSPRKWFITQLDSDVRSFILDTAKKNWVDGIDEINKQTRAYYKLMEGIGQWQDKIQGNNPISLTDYLAFTADPVLFWVKRVWETWLFKNKSLQLLNKVSGRQITPEVNTANIKNTANDIWNTSISRNSIPGMDDVNMTRGIDNTPQIKGKNILSVLRDRTIDNMVRDTGLPREEILQLFIKYKNDINKIDEMVAEILRRKKASK